ncbi:MAG: hypothetical protein HC869_16430 [Rhodospirillales bacterium]|nr:hypothetical protein [Rhodospirillales bacterium]
MEQYKLDGIVALNPINVFYLSTNAKTSNVTAAWRAHKRGAFFASRDCHPQSLGVLATRAEIARATDASVRRR